MKKPKNRAHETEHRQSTRRLHVATEKVLAEGWGRLSAVTFDWLRRDGRWQTQTREVYDHGNGAAILLYDPDGRTVVMVRQFRYPAFAEGGNGLLLEAAAGKLDEASPEKRIRAETEEETGFRIGEVRPVFAAYMSPGSLTEKLFFFVARYVPEDRVSEGGGRDEEGEDIEVVEIEIDEAMALIQTGEICDAKTIMLLQYAALNLFTRR